MSWIVYALSLMAYYALHSFLASEFMKSIFRKKLGIEQQTYRLVFNIVAIVTSVAIIYLFRNTEKIWSGDGSSFGYLLVILGLVIVSMALHRYGMLVFAGLKNEEANTILVKEGLNSWVRHPLYAGVLLALTGWFIVNYTIAGLVTLIITWIYVHIGINLEEKKLIAQFGEDYREYIKKVPKLWPMK